MTIQQPAIFAFNRGLISQLGLARTDLKRMALSASIQTNLMPRMLGSAMLRPGWQYIGATVSNAKARMLGHVFSTTDVSLVEVTAGTVRFWVPGSSGMPDTLLSRVSVASAITNGTFSGSLTGWTNNDGAGALSQWVAGNFMELTGTGFNAADEYQLVIVAAGDVGQEHGLRIVVALGTVMLNVGTSHGDGTYAYNLALGVGQHSIAFTPTGNFYIDISNASETRADVSSIAVEGPGVVALPGPWQTSDLQNIRRDQSAEVLYVACKGFQQRKILRWGAAGQSGARSWSIELYQPTDGPFLLENTTGTTITPSGLTGVVTLTASAPLFKPGHVGALFRMTSTTQDVTFAAAGANQWSQAIQITGVGTTRNFQITGGGTFSATIVLQQSIGAVGNWTNVGTVTPGTAGIPSAANWTAVGNTSTWTSGFSGIVNDGFDNSIIFYRIGIAGTYTSGTANVELQTNSGGKTGIVRVATVSGPTSAAADVMIQPNDTGVLSGLGAATATTLWSEGLWSGQRGWPTSVGLFEGRLCWAGVNNLSCSAADAYESFDDTLTAEGDAIIETIGYGPVDTINFLLPMADLVLGSQGAEIVCRSTVFGGAITPTSVVLRNCGTQGSANVPGLVIDFNGVFLQRSGRRLYWLQFTPNFFGMDYSEQDLTNFVPDIAIMENGAPLSVGGFNWLAVQRQPDTRIHAILNDGTERIMVFDPAEDEHAWVKVQTAGIIEDVVVLPGQGGTSSAEDLVYYVVNRTVNGSTVRYLERMAREDECIGGAVNKCADAHIAFLQPASTTVGGLSHLIGQQVVCWADGGDQGGPFTVSGSGTITLPNAVSSGCVGLGYTWQFQSTKLAFAAQLGTALAQKKRIARLGIIAANMHWQAFQYGKDFNSLQDLPSTYKGGPVMPGTVFASWDDETFAFGGNWDTDARLCLQGSAPRPVQLLGCVIDMEMRERT